MAWYNFWKKTPDRTSGTASGTASDRAPHTTEGTFTSPWISKGQSAAPQSSRPQAPRHQAAIGTSRPAHKVSVTRYFYNMRGFQTYASFFAHWDGWITAGHCLTEAQDMLPDFAHGPVHCHPDGLDAATLGCTLPDSCPAAPYPGQEVTITGYPAGSSVAATRHGKVYMERPGGAGSWIAHIITPDEPVVSGMSGGAVIDTASGTPIGIIVTRNSPADLNNDRDPDESCDFAALSDVWRAVQALQRVS